MQWPRRNYTCKEYLKFLSWHDCESKFWILVAWPISSARIHVVVNNTLVIARMSKEVKRKLERPESDLTNVFAQLGNRMIAKKSLTYQRIIGGVVKWSEVSVTTSKFRTKINLENIFSPNTSIFQIKISLENILFPQTTICCFEMNPENQNAAF